MRPRVTLAMQPATLADALFATSRERIEEIADIHPEVLTNLKDPSHKHTLASTDILLGGWGCTFLDQDLLEGMPHLRAVLYAGGSATAILDAAQAQYRDIHCADAGEANAKAVAEYTFAVVVLANKRAAYSERLYRERRALIDRERELADAGNFRTVVGLIGASRIGARVAQLLQATDMEVLIYDPYSSDDDVVQLGATKVDLEQLLRASHVVSIHAPETPETFRMIGERQLNLMRDGAVIVNTARGSLVDHEALIQHLRSGRLHAILDVTDPEPLGPDSELWDLPNVQLTPHIAGAMGNELHRLGESIANDLERMVRKGLIQSGRTVPKEISVQA